MDLRDSNTQKIALGILAFLFVVYFWYSRVYTENDNRIVVKTQEFEQITTNLKNVEMKAKSLEALKEEYVKLLERYNVIESLLPEVKQIPSFLVQLHTASSLTGTKITEVLPLPIAQEDFYNIVSFNIKLSGTYHDLGTFVSYVANFPFITNVSDVDLSIINLSKSDKDKESKDGLTEIGKEKTVDATFKLSTYYVKENERLQELVL
jgi:type IV pilus assembly protein PilO